MTMRIITITITVGRITIIIGTTVTIGLTITIASHCCETMISPM
jgi:hypothetical protein